MLSVNTNYSAMIALQNLNFTNTELEGVQNKINTGLKISSARDNGAIFAIAEGQRSRVSSVAAVKDGIDRANSTIDVALAAGKSIGEILQNLKAKAVAAQADDLTAGPARRPPGRLRLAARPDRHDRQLGPVQRREPRGRRAAPTSTC